MPIVTVYKIEAGFWKFPFANLYDYIFWKNLYD